MTRKSEWQEVNRELIAEQRRELGDPPTAEEMLAYSRGELPESEEERIRDLLVAYPEVARMYGAAFPEEGDAVPEAELAAGWNGLQRRLATGKNASGERRDGQRGRVVFRHWIPTSVAALIALAFFGLFVQAEMRARDYAEQEKRPRLLAAPQELNPDAHRGAGAPTMLRKDGEAYLLKPIMLNQVRYPHYRLELYDGTGALIWSNASAQPDENNAFQIVVPHTFLRGGETYQLRVSGIDGKRQTPAGSFDFAVPSE